MSTKTHSIESPCGVARNNPGAPRESNDSGNVDCVLCGWRLNRVEEEFKAALSEKAKRGLRTLIVNGIPVMDCFVGTEEELEDYEDRLEEEELTKIRNGQII